ncbi:MAG: hypothetical protein J5J00_15540 [Deltaproteobacteria bacterium]|nr:hypothetical protein [Deltaproteobacteria bacterium]
MKQKRDGKSKNNKAAAAPPAQFLGEINNEADLKAFLQNVRDKMAEETAPPVYAFAVMNQILTTPDIFTLLNNENKEVARDIWLRIKQAGFQARNPAMLFGSDEGLETSTVAPRS